MTNNKLLTTVRVAKWYGNKPAAVSLRFDDACETHVKVAVPVLNKHGLKGTFMVNPGRKSYLKYKEFWEKETPRSGHKLGNHTWSHHGAGTHKEAEYEIGAVSDLIWKMYPDQSKLLVFASGGGGKKWGGRIWSNADPAYKQLVEKYHLIDLYDGAHPAISADSNIDLDKICQAVRQAIIDGTHQAYLFHRIGKPARTLKGLARYLLKGYDISFREMDFKRFIGYLSELQEQVWIAPLIDILKYETESAASDLKLIDNQEKKFTFSLEIGTDVEFYDHPLTLTVPGGPVNFVKQITADNREPITCRQKKDISLFDVQPVNSKIIIEYR